MPGDDGWFGYRLGYFEFRMKYLDYYWVKLKSQAITQDGVTTTTTFKYRSTDTEKKKPLDCNVIGIEMSNSNQKKVVSAYKYPRDYDLNDSFVEYMAIERNMVEIMMEQRDSVGTTETQLYKVSYISWGEHENPINLKSYKIIAPSLFTLTRKGETQNLQQVHIYDIHGNPVYITENNSDKTVYFWGYNHQYPIIEVKNKAYDEIKSSLSSPSQGFYDGFMSQANPPDGMIQSFGDMLRRELTDALVTTYTYKPLVGMTSMTDPRGVTTYYDYDDFGRLKETYRMENGVKKIVQVHDYHYSLP